MKFDKKDQLRYANASRYNKKEDNNQVTTKVGNQAGHVATQNNNGFHL